MKKYIDEETVSATYVPVEHLGVANGVATLGTTGKVPASQLPNYTDVNYVPSDELPSLTGKQEWTYEQIFNYEDYGQTLVDNINGIACGFKAPRGLFNQLFVEDLVFTREGKQNTDPLREEIGFYIFTGIESKSAVRDANDNITTEGYNNLLGYEKVAAITSSGALRLKSKTAGSTKYFDITVDDSGTLTATEVT